MILIWFLVNPAEICNKTSLKRYFYENNVEKINLLKINIEGAEYDILNPKE